MRRFFRALARPIVRAHRRRVSPQKGVAILVVAVAVSVLAAVTSEFSYNARVEMEAAANARDQLRAEYLARSGINLSRLLIKVQQSVLDPIAKQFKFDIQIADFAPLLMKAFGGSDGSEMLSGLLGIDAGQIKGLGVGKGADFDVQMVAEDGKININCGGGFGGGPIVPAPNTSTPAPNAPLPVLNKSQRLYTLLTALMFPTRYNRLFDNPDPEGQYSTRDEVARAIIDWSDVDEVRFDPTGASGNSEDYRYDALRDPYRAHNNYYDTLDEAQLVKGVGDDWWGSFGDMLTVYGGCKVNLNAVKPEHWPIVAAIIRASAKDPNNPMLYDENIMAALAQQIGQIAQLTGGLQGPGDLATYASGKLPQSLTGGSSNNQNQNNQPQLTPIPGMQPIPLDAGRLSALATTGPRTVWRLDSTGKVERGTKSTSVHIRAVFDTQHFNQNSTSPDINDRMGTWVYWRQE